MPVLQLLAALCLCLCYSAAAADSALTWPAEQRKFACAGTYARVKLLADNRLALVYSRGADVCIRFSEGTTAVWGTEAVVARTAGYGNTNAELVELANGWLIYAWNGRPTGGGAYFIASKRSRDGGNTWGEESRVYTAGTESGTGCWEPAFLLLPSGELQVYFANESPYPVGGDQEIGMLHSQDSGLTWKQYTKVSHRAGARDGMPVPLRLKDGTVAVAIEDNGLDGDFKPAILHAEADAGWTGGPVAGEDDRRFAAFAPSAKPPTKVYAGAPYLARLPSGMTLLSVQSNEGRTATTARTDESVMQVYLGGADAQGFATRSTPFPDIPAGGSGLWNSLTVLDDSTVMAVSSLRGMGKDGIWTAIGKVRSGPIGIRFQGIRNGTVSDMLRKRSREAFDARGRRAPFPAPGPVFFSLP